MSVESPTNRKRMEQGLMEQSLMAQDIAEKGLDVSEGPIYRVDSDGEEVEVHFAETEVEPGEIFGETASPEKIATEASQIFQRIEESHIDHDDETQTTDLLRKLQKKHKDFYNTFPVVVRWMVQVGEYDPQAFREYLDIYKEKIGATGMWKSRKDFLENQADYLRMLLQKKNARGARGAKRATRGARGAQHRTSSRGVRKLTQKQIYEYKRSILRQLEQEDREFKEASEEAKEEVKRIDSQASENRKQEILKYLRYHKQNAPAAKDEA